ncbi:MAG TPA: hypothetical protein VNL77_17715 [Roseiflexaceae bacterium]|nr:hypothetical protein [Roseiflexaceae bacterium]
MLLTLASTHHDPPGRLIPQLRRVLPELVGHFGAIAVRATQGTLPEAVALLEAAGALVRRGPTDSALLLGRARRDALALALETGADALLFCDFDRILHWAEQYPAELAGVIQDIPRRDVTVLGRTRRAFDTHPRVQRDTEAIVNAVYADVSGHPWDVTAAARGLSRRAAAAILGGCPEETIGTDVAWPLFAQRAGLTLGYIQTEGLEFETADRFADEIAAAGGLERWMAHLDADPRRWAARLEFARVEVEAALPYTTPPGTRPGGGG